MKLSSPGEERLLPAAARKDTHKTEKRSDHGPAVLHPGPRPIADHVLDTVIKVITACKRQRQTDVDPVSDAASAPGTAQQGLKGPGGGGGEGVSPGPHPGPCITNPKCWQTFT